MQFRLVLIFVFGLIALRANAQVDSLRVQEGMASFYGKKFHGKKTANGEVFSLDSLTAAHKRLPLGTWVRVINQKNKLSVVVRINDRLPIYSKRQIDISRAAAERIEMVQDGLAKVKIEALDLDELDRLIAYYQDRDSSPLRLRPYYRIIQMPQRELDLRLNEVLLPFSPDSR
ncbi:septal ring lytic transglycosylase RlpA family protein [Algoriphagus jejuensis]|uniref:septal ring lytic transglycosylase RlpA family protein n=1 Tax=Algoriphagus jejuensis TaxID=419934 RepID=UPI0031CE2903